MPTTSINSHSAGIVYAHTVGFQANQGRGFNNPVDLAMDSQGVLYILNRAGPEMAIRMPYKRVSICTAEAEYLGEFGTGGTGNGEVWWPSSLAFATDGAAAIGTGTDTSESVTSTGCAIARL